MVKVIEIELTPVEQVAFGAIISWGGNTYILGMGLTCIRLSDGLVAEIPSGEKVLAYPNAEVHLEGK